MSGLKGGLFATNYTNFHELKHWQGGRGMQEENEMNAKFVRKNKYAKKMDTVVPVAGATSTAG